jgi:signal transduction histidine kinase
MRERAGLHGGAIEWSSRPTGGTTVTVRLPIGGGAASGQTPGGTAAPGSPPDSGA